MNTKEAYSILAREKKRLEDLAKPGSKKEALHLLEDIVFKTFKPGPGREQTAHACFGLAGEVGELVDAYKKHMFYEQALDYDNVREEIGDCLYYLQVFCLLNGTSIAECIGALHDKLSVRYKDGFSPEAAAERKDKC